MVTKGRILKEALRNHRKPGNCFSLEHGQHCACISVPLSERAQAGSPHQFLDILQYSSVLHFSSACQGCGLDVLAEGVALAQSVKRA